MVELVRLTRSINGVSFAWVSTNLTPNFKENHKLGKKKDLAHPSYSFIDSKMRASLLTSQSSIQFFLSNPYLPSPFQLYRPSNFLRFISSSNPQILPSIRCFSDSSKPSTSVYQQEPIDPTVVHEESSSDQWKLEVQSPPIPASAVRPAKLSFNDQAFFLLAFIACTVMGFPCLVCTIENGFFWWFFCLVCGFFVLRFELLMTHFCFNVQTSVAFTSLVIAAVPTLFVSYY